MPNGVPDLTPGYSIPYELIPERVWRQRALARVRRFVRVLEQRM